MLYPHPMHMESRDGEVVEHVGRVVGVVVVLGAVVAVVAMPW